jgi:hypothetical protein
MTVDDRDLGVRPEFAGLVPLAEKMDAEKAVIAKDLEPVIARAKLALARRDYVAAADAYDEIARTWRTFHFTGDAETYEERAKDFRAVLRLEKRKAKKGRGRRK